MSDWISVEDGSGLRNGQIVLTTDGRGVAAHRYEYTAYGNVVTIEAWVIIELLRGSAFTDKQITHWQPLPEPPTEER